MIEISPSKYAKNPSAQGVYGLVDPRTKKVRYVGTSTNLNSRVYSHIHSTSVRGNTTKDQWVRELAKEGKRPTGVLLCGEALPKANKDRHALEATWIEKLPKLGEADLNSRLTPIGHRYGQGGPKQVVQENYLLRARVAQLERDLAEALSARREAV